MRIRTIVAIALLLPVVADAQRRSPRGRIGGGRAIPVAPLPQGSPVLAREMSYAKLPISIEPYSFISYVQSPTAFSDEISSWGTYSVAVRFDYKLNDFFSATADMAQSVFGGPEVTSAFELGTRLHLLGKSNENTFRPFVDARIGYSYSQQSFLFLSDPTTVFPTAFLRNRFGHGIGLIAGTGSEFAITKSLSMTTGMWAVQSNVHSTTMNLGQPLPAKFENYFVTSYRLALGLKWNPIRATINGQGDINEP